MNELSRPSITFPEIVYPWDINLESIKWTWASNFLATRPYYDKHIWLEPNEPKLAEQVAQIFPYLHGSRNFILCFSGSPTYMRDLYSYLAAIWCLSMNSRAEIADIQDLIESVYRDFDRREAFQEADLLILPFAEKDHVGLNKARGSLSNLLMRRRAKNLATITDLYVAQRPANSEGCSKHAKKLVDVYGSLAFDLFYGDRAKYIYVSSPTEKGEQDGGERRKKRAVG